MYTKNLITSKLSKFTYISLRSELCKELCQVAYGVGKSHRFLGIVEEALLYFNRSSSLLLEVLYLYKSLVDLFG